MSIFLFMRTVIYITFLMAWHFAGSVKPIIFSGLMTLMKGKSEFLAICAAKDVLPLLGGPKNKTLLHNTSPQVLNFEVKWFKGKTSHESFHIKRVEELQIHYVVIKNIRYFFFKLPWNMTPVYSSTW